MTTKLERLLEKEAQLKAQIQQAKAAERTLEKKKDTRRKILIGAAVMARVDNEEWPKDDLLRMMDGFLTRPNERDLFNLDHPDDDAATGENARAGDRAAKANQKKLEGRSADAAKTPKKAKKIGRSRTDLAEPDFDVDKEFNL